MDLNHNVSGSSLNVRISGHFTFSDNGAFRSIVNKLKDPGITQAHLDCKGLEFVDSAGLGLLMLCKDTASTHGVAISLTIPEGQAGKMFIVSRFDKMFTITS